MKHLSFFILCCLFFSYTASAQRSAPAASDSQIVQERTVKEEKKDMPVEERLQSIDKELQRQTVHNDKRYNDLKSRIEYSVEMVAERNRVMGFAFIIMIAVVVLVVMAIIITRVQMRKQYKEQEKMSIAYLNEINKQAKTIQKYQNRIEKSKVESENIAVLQRLSLFAGNLADNYSDFEDRRAKNIAADSNAIPFEYDWAKALILFSNDSDYEAILAKFKRLTDDYTMYVSFKSLSSIYSVISCLYMLTKDEAESESYFTGSVTLNPRNAVAWNNRGIGLQLTGRNEEAIACFDKSIALEPDDEIIFYNKGNSLYRLERFDEAIECYDKAAEINPGFAMAWNNKGLCLAQLNRCEEAIASYDNAIRINPYEAEVWNNKAACLYSSGKYDEAVACYNKAAEIRPDNTEAWYYYNKGNSYLASGNYTEAAGYFDKAIGLKPDFAEALEGKEKCLATSNDDGVKPVEEIPESPQEPEKVVDEMVELWNNRGNDFYNKSQYNEAIACFDIATTIDPDYGDSWYNKGGCLYQLGRFEKAVECFDKAIERTPGFAEAWYNKGVTLEELNRVEEAEICFKRALEINPAIEEE